MAPLGPGRLGSRPAGHAGTARTPGHPITCAGVSATGITPPFSRPLRERIDAVGALLPCAGVAAYQPWKSRGYTPAGSMRLWPSGTPFSASSIPRGSRSGTRFLRGTHALRDRPPTRCFSPRGKARRPCVTMKWSVRSVACRGGRISASPWRAVGPIGSSVWRGFCGPLLGRPWARPRSSRAGATSAVNLSLRIRPTFNSRTLTSPTLPSAAFRLSRSSRRAVGMRTTTTWGATTATRPRIHPRSMPCTTSSTIRRALRSHPWTAPPRAPGGSWMPSGGTRWARRWSVLAMCIPSCGPACHRRHASPTYGGFTVSAICRTNSTTRPYRRRWSRWF
mmetsp:Transcript_66586/g.111367  ORF Transcript_66586/g.111367 Transcript_66586/m.111367 type:complete len:335 (+) Transcript_66586:202-1206(+)